MKEIFFNYARSDNKINSEITGEPDQIISRFKSLFEEIYRRGSGIKDLSNLIFMDVNDIEDGQIVKNVLDHEIKHCSVMFSFYSPTYFESEFCYDEWRLFNNYKENDKKKRKLLIAIEVDPVSKINEDAFQEGKNWFDEITKNIHRNISSNDLRDNSNQNLTEKIKNLVENVKKHISKNKGIIENRELSSNILIIDKKIKDSIKMPEIEKQIIEENSKLKFSSKPVCIIYTGGTIGMIKVGAADELHADYLIAEHVKEIVRPLRTKLSSLPFNMHFFGMEPTIDSSNIKIEDWYKLAKIIEEQIQNYQGFVILHGTNTLAYSSSMLSFLLNDFLNVPVIFTGSEVPLTMPNSDAEHNILNAIRAAAHDSHNGPMLVPEVTVFWNTKLFRGNRVTKKYASDRTESFHSPNMHRPLGTLAQDKLNVDSSLIFRRRSLFSYNVSHRDTLIKLDAIISILLIYPEMDITFLKASEKKIDGLILLSYGPGNSPDNDEFTKLIREMILKGTIIVNVTQCPYGKVELKLFETSAVLFDLGVIDAGDMTLESAYCKLLWVLSKKRENRMLEKTIESIKNNFQKNIAGEMSVSIHTFKIGHSNTFLKNIKLKWLISDTIFGGKEINPYDIVDVFLRIEGIKLETNPELYEDEYLVLFGPPDQAPKDSTKSSKLLASFKKKIEKKNQKFDKNLEITHIFRKCFRSEDFELSFCNISETPFCFNSVQLIVYTRESIIINE
ncbi:1-alkyl-2-acetylglycerophosphocholine esterase [Candidatus Magnetomorum sp. HK-1]|nr:1-alkyl-2-acetylglycerophosphocholine esterase [Candidatus Magnetomorum sp. HK-1]